MDSASRRRPAPLRTRHGESVSAAERLSLAEQTEARILVVDDVPMFRELEQLFLSSVGRVRTASTAEEALSEAVEFGPEVIVLDLHLPDRPGDEIAAELREASAPGCVVVIVTTGLADEHARAVYAGAADVLAKPLSRGTLVQAVSRFVGRSEAPLGLPRVNHMAPVRLASEDRVISGTIRNLSRGGLFIEADWMPPEGTEMSLTFDLPGVEHGLEPTARIVWRKFEAGQTGRSQSGIGVRFVALDGSASRELHDFVYERTSYDGSWLDGPEL